MMESHLLGRYSLLHLNLSEQTGYDEDLHLHARIPGLNSIAEGEIVNIDIDPAQVFVFSQS